VYGVDAVGLAQSFGSHGGTDRLEVAPSAKTHSRAINCGAVPRFLHRPILALTPRFGLEELPYIGKSRGSGMAQVEAAFCATRSNRLR
jgi:hypothetical protein